MSRESHEQMLERSTIEFMQATSEALQELVVVLGKVSDCLASIDQKLDRLVELGAAPALQAAMAPTVNPNCNLCTRFDEPCGRSDCPV